MAHLLDAAFDGDPIMDHSNVRADCTCPLCHGPKDRGLVACWTCYRTNGLRIASGSADAIFSRRDQYLANLSCS